MTIWTPGAFIAKTALGAGSPPADREMVGWVWNGWALDFRVWETNRDDDCRDWPDYAPGWAVTHIPTGYQAFGLFCELAKAKAIVEEFDWLADWNFTDFASDAFKEASARTKLFREQHKDIIHRGAASYSQFACDMIYERAIP